MLVDQLKEMKHFTNNEKDIAKYILTHLEDVPELTSDQLAKVTFTSKATVIRLCKKLGVSGYQAFKLKLVAEINQQNRIDSLLANEPITNESTQQDIIDILPDLYDKSITNTRLSLNKTIINRLNNRLKICDKIYLYGTGISYTLAQSAAYKFSTLGVESLAFESINSYGIAARKNEKTLVFLISFTGANKSIYQIAKYLKTATNFYVVGILGPHREKISSYVDEIIDIPNKDSLLSLDVIHSYTSANYVIDIIFGLILAQKYDNHVESSLEMLKYRELLFEKFD